MESAPDPVYPVKAGPIENGFDHIAHTRVGAAGKQDIGIPFTEEECDFMGKITCNQFSPAVFDLQSRLLQFFMALYI